MLVFFTHGVVSRQGQPRGKCHDTASAGTSHLVVAMLPSWMALLRLLQVPGVFVPTPSYNEVACSVFFQHSLAVIEWLGSGMYGGSLHVEWKSVISRTRPPSTRKSVAFTTSVVADRLGRGMYENGVVFLGYDCRCRCQVSS